MAPAPQCFHGGAEADVAARWGLGEAGARLGPATRRILEELDRHRREWAEERKLLEDHGVEESAIELDARIRALRQSVRRPEDAFATFDVTFRIRLKAGCDAPNCDEAGTKRCPCGDALYCSRACQRAHWKAHRARCRAAKREAPTFEAQPAEPGCSTPAPGGAPGPDPGAGPASSSSCSERRELVAPGSPPGAGPASGSCGQSHATEAEAAGARRTRSCSQSHETEAPGARRTSSCHEPLEAHCSLLGARLASSSAGEGREPLEAPGFMSGAGLASSSSSEGHELEPSGAGPASSSASQGRELQAPGSLRGARTTSSSSSEGHELEAPSALPASSSSAGQAAEARALAAQAKGADSGYSSCDEEEADFGPGAGMRLPKEETGGALEDAPSLPPECHRIKVEHFPPLPSKAVRRLQGFRERGEFPLERRLFEAYLSFLEINEREGICAMDLSGPESFYDQVEKMRPQVEEAYRLARRKWDIFKRLGSTPGLSRDKAEKLVQPVLSQLEEAQRSFRAYEMLRRLWEECTRRVRGTVDEEDFRKRLATQEEGGRMIRSLQPKETKAEVKPTEEKPWFRRWPRFGMYEPLPVDAVPPLQRVPEIIPEVHHTEELYLELTGMCQEGKLCVRHCFVFEEKMNREKNAIKKAVPGRARISSAAIYNRVVNHWDSSLIREELECHKLWMLRHPGNFFQPPGSRCVPANVGDRLALDSATEALRKQVDLQPVAASDLPALEDGSPAESAQPLTASVAQGAAAGVEDAEQATSPPEEDEEDLESICVSCICRAADLVLRECGHLVYCRSCRRKAVAQELQRRGGVADRGRRAQLLTNKELGRTKVRCPMCREEGVLVPKEKFAGTLYTV